MLTSPPYVWEILLILAAAAITLSCLIHLSLRRRDELLVDYFTPEDVSEEELDLPSEENAHGSEETAREKEEPEGTENEWPDAPQLEPESPSH
jgi:hypothetical protein